MDSLLLQFNADIQTKEALKLYLIEHFEREIIAEVLEGKDVKALGEAINKLNKAFEQLAIDYDVTLVELPFYRASVSCYL